MDIGPLDITEWSLVAFNTQHSFTCENYKSLINSSDPQSQEHFIRKDTHNARSGEKEARRSSSHVGCSFLLPRFYSEPSTTRSTALLLAQLKVSAMHVGLY